ncbi:unnamed protein product [Phaedon cochleariae]|uniref:Uncharacterized protein n=1 Tax=Phaedon cochleariae TaxID=80249 RepID=A0A9N9SJM1_PHACE|nr:unnamed protein product [Phaedon cochleariae]
MIKFGGVLEDGQPVQRHQRTKYIISSVSTNDNAPLSLNGRGDLIPIDWEGRLVRESVPVNELGKQLLKASAEGDVDNIKHLLVKGAPFTADWLGTSPLHLAAQNNHLEITEILLRAGISKDARTKVDRTPLHMAAYEGHLDIVETLLKHGADIDSKDLLGMTPLHWAVQNGHLEIVAHLIRHGASINKVNKFDLLPADIAQQIHRTDIETFITDSNIENTEAATQNLVIQLAAEDDMNNSGGMQVLNDDMELDDPIDSSVIRSYKMEGPIVIDDDDTIESINNENTHCDIEDDESQETIQKANESLIQNVTVDHSNLTDSLKLLHEHGIMLQNKECDNNNILNSVMESGHSVVLTDVGKEVLNSVKQSEQTFVHQQSQPLEQPSTIRMEKKIVTLTPEQFLAITQSRNDLRQWKIPAKGQLKRVVMKKNKTIPIPTVAPVHMQPQIKSQIVMNSTDKFSRSDVDQIIRQLLEARKTIEEYKIKLKKKEQEAENYKMQLKLLMDSS